MALFLGYQRGIFKLKAQLQPLSFNIELGDLSGRIVSK